MNQKVLPTDKVFLKNTNRVMIDWSRLFEFMYVDGLILKEDAKKIIQTVNKFLQSEPNLLYLQDPVTLVGDIHG
jgi:serine/threonine-protein phosphatase 2B catalytic subunit